MPVDIFGYYTLLEPYISAYYEVDAKDKGRQLYLKVSKKYQESLTYFSSIPEEKQERLIDEISTDIARYRSLIDLLFVYEEEEFVRAEMEKYNNFIRLFTGETEEVPQLDDPDIQKDTTIPIDTTQ